MEDIVEAWVGWLPAVLTESRSSAGAELTAHARLDTASQQVLSGLTYQLRPLDGLSQALGVAVEELLSHLMALELDGSVEQQGGCWMRCR
ncbi:MAG: putative Rossmann fold nucleotide-binding protein DprA/Smf involved in DNA uptake [Bermanella sp.]